jgi:hypothetical protein
MRDATSVTQSAPGKTPARREIFVAPQSRPGTLGGSRRGTECPGVNPGLSGDSSARSHLTELRNPLLSRNPSKPSFVKLRETAAPARMAVVLDGPRRGPS